MIVTVTLNPALDLTYEIDALVPHGTHRVTRVAERPGGKGLNVARVLHQLGEPVLATGLLGGATGQRVTDLLAAEGVVGSFVRIAGETRRTVAVVDAADATGFWEPGPAVSAPEWSLFVAEFRTLLRTASVVALSGSLPPGIPPDGYATLIRHAATAGVPAVLDTSGPALRAGLRAGPALAKPNASELAALLPVPLPLVDAVRALAAGPVVVSRGADGLLAVAGGARPWAARPYAMAGPARRCGRPLRGGRGRPGGRRLRPRHLPRFRVRRPLFRRPSVRRLPVRRLPFRRLAFRDRSRRLPCSLPPVSWLRPPRRPVARSAPSTSSPSSTPRPSWPAPRPPGGR
jgi:tagatose 6-phosphate kinase